MLGDGCCRVVMYLLGYVVPSYHCYKVLEKKDADKIREWCIYWLLLGLLTTLERTILDRSVFWLPLYYEAKVLFVVYLWHPRTQGALYLYAAHVRPFLIRHESGIDQQVQGLKSYASNFCSNHFQRLTQLLQTRVISAMSALHNMQQAKIEEMGPRANFATGRSGHAKSKTGSDLLDELPSVPTNKIE